MEHTHDRETIIEMPVVLLSKEEDDIAKQKYNTLMDSKEVSIRCTISILNLACVCAEFCLSVRPSCLKTKVNNSTTS